MPETVDARGLSCPQPVILTRRALENNSIVTTIVDEEIAERNVTRMAEIAGGTVQVEKKDDGIYLHITQRGTPEKQTMLHPQPAPIGGPLVLVIPSDAMGRGDAELGQILIRGFLHALGEVEHVPDTIIFFNDGVKLVVHGSPVLEDLKDLSRRGTEILACGTCLAYHELKEMVAVGEVSNMYTIAETTLSAGRVVTL